MAAKQYEYARGAFYGNEYIGGTAAPEFGGLPRREEERKVVIPAPPVVREQTATRAKVRYEQAVSPVSIIGLACAAVLLVFTLMAKIQYTTVADQTVALESQLEELNVERTRLQIQYESVFNMTEIEEYATSVLGMQRPRDEQVYYINSSVPDKAVIIESTKEKEGLLDRINDLLKSIGEYF